MVTGPPPLASLLLIEGEKEREKSDEGEKEREKGVNWKGQTRVLGMISKNTADARGPRLTTSCSIPIKL